MTVVHFETDFDRPAVAVTIPATVTSGFASEVQAVDGLLRSSRFVGRFAMSPGMVGLKVTAAGRPVRVTVSLTADAATADYTRARSTVGESPYRERELVLRSQGKTRAAVMLGRRPGDFTFRTSVVVVFDLTADEAPDDGLLIVELAEAVRGSRALVGVRLDRIVLSDATVQREPSAAESVSTGVPAIRGTAQLVSDGFMANGDTWTWTLRGRLTRVARADPPPPKRTGALVPARPTGEAEPRIREKAIALGRRKAGDAWFKARLAARHTVSRTAHWIYVVPVGSLVGGLWRRTGRITATIAPVTGLAPDGRAPLRCIVRRAGWGRIVVTSPIVLDGPAVVRLTAPTWLGLTPTWRLQTRAQSGAEKHG